MASHPEQTTSNRAAEADAAHVQAFVEQQPEAGGGAAEPFAHPTVDVFPLGAAQDVGRSCFVVVLNHEAVILLDCGIHPLHNDELRFPHFAAAAEFVRTAVRPGITARTAKAALARDERTVATAGTQTPAVPAADECDPHPRGTAAGFLARVDCVLITHFHLDHAGALPLLQLGGYNGPILMTAPTAAMTPPLLREAYSARMQHTYTHLGVSVSDMDAAVAACLRNVVVVQLNETLRLPTRTRGGSATSAGLLEVTPYYAGHVIGAAMFHVVLPAHDAGTTGESARVSVLYTGDFNMQPTHHLRAADVRRLKPDVLITESTFAAKRKHDAWSSCEAVFLQHVAAAVRRGGRVLIPCSSTGPVQDMCIMLERYWTLHGIEAPIFLSSGLSEQALGYYKLYVQWTSAGQARAGSGQPGSPVNPRLDSGAGALGVAGAAAPTACLDHPADADDSKFRFSHIGSLPPKLHRNHHGHSGDSMVVLATAAMLKGGKSLELFKLWCGDARNLVVLPGYCSAGSVGFQLQRGAREVQINGVSHAVRCECVPVSFMCHADQHGIVELVRRCSPANVLLVHGDRGKMDELRQLLQQLFGLPCVCPQRHQPLHVQARPSGQSKRLVQLLPSEGLLRQSWCVSRR